MNRTSVALANPTPEIERTEDAQQLTLGVPEQPAAILLFPRRDSNSALAWLASVDVSPSARRTGRFAAGYAAVHPRSVKYRNIHAGDLACWMSFDTMSRGLGKSVRTVKRNMEELIGAGLNRQRTTRCNTYIWPLPNRPNLPETRAKIAENGTLGDTPIEPRTEVPKEEPPQRTRETPARRRCHCGNTWPAEYGDDCHDCERRARAERRARRPRRKAAPLPANVREQIARTNPLCVVMGRPDVARKNKIALLELAIERHGDDRTAAATLHGWRRELAAAHATSGVRNDQTSDEATKPPQKTSTPTSPGRNDRTTPRPLPPGFAAVDGGNQPRHDRAGAPPRNRRVPRSNS